MTEKDDIVIPITLRHEAARRELADIVERYERERAEIAFETGASAAELDEHMAGLDELIASLKEAIKNLDNVIAKRSQ
jgi:hypothetical protein